MSNSGRPSVDHKLPHRIEDWARSTGSTPLERDADAIVAWLRDQRGSEYARKPADGLRRQQFSAVRRHRPAIIRAPAVRGCFHGPTQAFGVSTRRRPLVDCCLLLIEEH